MNKWYLALGIGSLALALFGYLDQAIRLKTSWDWTQFWHHENLILIALTIGLILLIVAIIETVRR